MAAWTAWLPGVVLLVLAAPAAAYEEHEAPRVRVVERGDDDVVAVWHEPEIVQPGTQWNGFVRFREGHGILNVSFQVCDVGRVCFAAPVEAERLDNDTWTFDTDNYRSLGKPIHYKAGWRLGTQFILTERMPDGTVETYSFPEGIEKPDDLEYHYFAFDMPAPATQTPHPWWLAFVALAIAAWRRRP